MRIIDADELLQKMQTEYYSTDRLIDQGELHLDTLAEGYTEVHGLIESLPTIEPESLIPHGRWEIVRIGSFSHYRCSACGSHAGIGRGYNKFSFCPACGARMEEEAEDG